MKKRYAASTLILAALPLLAVGETADTIFLGEHIITMEAAQRDMEPTAVAVKGEQIIWTGFRGEHTDLIGEQTEVIKLGERALLPGFIDAHGHFSFSAAVVDLANVASPPVGPVKDMDSLRTTLLKYIDDKSIEDGAWVVGFGYDDSLLAEGRHPTRADLDKVSTTHPIALTHVSGHLATMNTAALEALGMDAETPDPPGGHIRREADGYPNGVLEETAIRVIQARMFTPTDPLGSLQRVQEVYAQEGITTVQDGYAAPGVIQSLRAADEAGVLKLDLHVYAGADPANPQTLDTHPWGQYQGRVKVAGIKMSLDGSPQGKTAYLTQPYHVPPDGQGPEYRGYPTLQQEVAHQLIAGFMSAGIPIIVHANGDAAGDMLISGVRAALAADEGIEDHRTVMIHAQTARHDQVQAMAELGMIPSYFSAHTFFWGDWHRDSVLGPVRGPNISPARWTIEAGGKFTVHNDAPVVPPNMVRLLWATTNRKTRSDQTLGPAQRVSTYAALRAMTADAAFQAFEEDVKGSIRAGKQADLVLLSGNPLLTPRARLLDLEVEQTYSRGALVFGR